MSEKRSEDGYLLDEWGREIGLCNSCWEEVLVGQECCDDGEAVAHE